MKELSDFQAEAISRGYTHDFGCDAKSEAADIINELRILEYMSFDSATDPCARISRNLSQ